MRNILFILLFNPLIASFLNGQDILQIKNYSDEQYERGNLTNALKEYQRVLLFDQEGRFREVYAKIANIYYELGDYDNAMVYYDFARRVSQSDSLMLEFSFRKILCYFRLDRYLLGLTDLYDLPEELSPYFQQKKSLYTGICHFGLDETDQALKYFSEIVDSAGYQRIDSTLTMLNGFRKKYDPDKLEMMSIFLPGLGQAVAGDLKSGLNSILLLGGIAGYSYYTMLSYGILDGTLVLTTWFYRYYTGGHRKAHELGEKKIQEQKHVSYLRILDLISLHSRK